VGSLKYLLDSTVVIDAANRVPGALDFLMEHYAVACISPVTRAEVLAGANAVNLNSLKDLLSDFRYLDLDVPSVDLAAALRREHRWKLPDAFQAGLALRHDLKLVTRNTKDFKPEKHAFVLVPYKL
jgi:predicted nucleic acid-binding protein